MTERIEDNYDIEEVFFLKTSTSDTEVDPFMAPVSELRALDGLNRGSKRKLSNLSKRYEGLDGTASKKIEDDVITGYDAFDVVSPPHNLDALAKLPELSSPHYAATHAKVANIAGLGYDFVPSPLAKRKIDSMESPDKRKKYQRKLNQNRDSLHELVESMNEEDTFVEILKKVWLDYEVTGNGYIEVSRSETTGRIGYVGHVPATTIRIRRARDGFVQIISNKAVFFRNFGKDDPDPIGGDTNPNEIIHIKKYAASSGFYGVPDIVAAQQAIAGNEFAGRFNLDYFENKAVPRHLITLKGATIAPALAKNILEFFETGLKGKNHRSLFIPLPSDTPDRKVELKIDPVEAGTQDSSFNNYKKANLNEILMAHRVPISKVGLAEGVSLAVARDADKTFKEQVCKPEQGIFEKKLNKIIAEFTDLYKLKLNEMTLTDEDTQSKIDERRIKTGQRTPNELRVRDGLPAHKDGDELVDLNIQAKKIANENRAQGNRERDAGRSASATDSAGEGRNPKGEGRTSG